MMEVSNSLTSLGRHHSADNKNESEESCPSLARSDSGQGKSLSSVDIPEEILSPDEAKYLESMKEIDDTSENGIFEETAWKTNKQNCLSRHERTGVCTSQDSAIEKSPTSHHLKCSHHLPETNLEDMSYRKQQKDMFEGPVSDITDVDRVKSEKCSLKRQASVDFSFHSLDVNSFGKDEPLCVYCSNKIPPPEVSFLSSTDSHNSALTQNLVNTVHECNISPSNYVLNKVQAQTNVNGHNKDDNTTYPPHVGVQNGCGQVFTSALSEAVISHMSLQGMVPRKTLDNAIKELTLAKQKISELERDNFNFYKGYEHYELRLSDLHRDVNYWKNKYLEIKEQLERKEHELHTKQEELHTKQEELHTKQEELNLQHVDLACLEALRLDVEDKDHELQTLREQCQTLRFQNEGHKSMLASSTVSDDVHEELQSVVRVRRAENSSDETQLKTV